jgi:signal transduction histidine kinase
MKLEDLVDETPRGNDARVQELGSILNVVRKLNTSLVISEVLELVLDEAIRITHADRGFLMLADGDRRLEFAVGRAAGGAPIQAESFQVSSSVLDDVFASGESLCIEHALSDERFERRQSIMDLELQTILCSPLRTPEETIGVIYVDSKCIHTVETADTLSLFEILAGQAAIAIKNARLYNDLKTAYDDLRHANEQIIKVERMAMKGEIAGQVSHELKNLVAVVLLQIHLMRERLGKVPAEETGRMMEKAGEAVEKIRVFSMNLLTQSRATEKLVPSDPNRIVGDFFAFIKVLPKFKRLRLTLELAEGLPAVALDTDQIQQVLLNLVNNAVEAAPDTAIEFRTLLDSEGQVRVIVQDHGPGIEEAVLAKLLKEKITTKPDGHGYGLPVCRQIVEHHGGRLEVASRLHEGAAFSMVLPPAAASAAPSPEG